MLTSRHSAPTCISADRQHPITHPPGVLCQQRPRPARAAGPQVSLITSTLFAPAAGTAQTAAMQQPPPQGSVQVEHGREPCPDRILDDIGGAFGMGAIGGGLWHTYRGLKSSPRGYKLIGTLETIRRESPRIGGNFANWGMMFSVFDCTCLYLRKKEDPFNAIMAGALTGGFLQIRAGLRPAFRSAVFGGVLLAIIEGLGITLSKMTSPPPPSMPFPQPGMPGAEGMPGGLPGAPPLPTGLPDLNASSSGDASSSSGGVAGFWSWLTGGEEPKKPETTATQTFEDEGFSPPPTPDFSSSGSFKQS